MNTEVVIIPQLEDNYCYLVKVPSQQKRVFIVDPSEPGPIMEYLDRHGIEGGYILNTHHHADHTQGNLELKQRYSLEIVANAEDRNRIPGVDIGLEGSGETRLLDTPLGFQRSPGHTRSHLLFHFLGSGDLFTGDTLFLLGCGRLFEGKAHELYESLGAIARLPPSTRLWCGHEYTLKNLEFAESILGKDDPGLARVSQKYRAARKDNQPTVPGILGEELAANPFFRCKNVEEFARLRELRNHF